MARYNKFAYGAQQYGVDTPVNLLWGLLIDWDDDGIFDGNNESPRLKHVSIQRGRNNLISPNGSSFEPIQPGALTITLDNYDRRYDPYNAASPLYPNVDTGRFVWLFVRVNDTVYNLFRGTLRDIVPSGDRVTITAEDGIGWLMDQQVSTTVYENTAADVAIGAVLDAAQWPWGRSLQAGADVLDYWWARGRSAIDEIRAIADSEFGRFYINTAGALVFNSRTANKSPVLTIDQSQILRDIAIPQPWEIRRNIVEVQSNPIAEQAETDIWQSTVELAVDAGATVTQIIRYNTPAVDVVVPAATTDYTAFSQTGGLGSNLTASIAVTLSTYAESATISVTNNSASLAYVNLLKVRGKPLETGAVKARTTGTGYDRRPRLFSVDLEWQQDVNNPAAFASQILDFLANARELPVIQIENRPEIQFIPDLFDQVTVGINARNLSDTFQIGMIQHEWLGETGQAVRTTWKTEPLREYTGWRFPVIFDVTSILG
jgi:hypothetical protein